MTIMTRALICDPELPAKTADGRLDDIRACIGCNQACIGHFHAGYPISCIQFPETGRGLPFPRPGAGGHQRHAGGGGRAARSRGGRGSRGAQGGGGRGGARARVTLVEAERWVGGQVRLAQKLPGRNEMGGAITNLEGEARRRVRRS